MSLAANPVRWYGPASIIFADHGGQLCAGMLLSDAMERKMVVDGTTSLSFWRETHSQLLWRKEHLPALDGQWPDVDRAGSRG